jgi:hypothetical protein
MSETLRPPPLGWPFDQIAAAGLRAADAERRLHAARVYAGTVDTPSHAHDAAERGRAAKAVWEAELDLEEARAAWLAVKRQVAAQFVYGLRAALEYERTALAELLGDLPAAPPVVEALSELEDRADALAGGIKAARGECWELGNWILRLERKQDTNTAGGAHGHRGPAQEQGVERGGDVRPGHERQAG